jgi:hypothetical protein
VLLRDTSFFSNLVRQSGRDGLGPIASHSCGGRSCPHHTPKRILATPTMSAPRTSSRAATARKPLANSTQAASPTFTILRTQHKCKLIYFANHSAPAVLPNATYNAARVSNTNVSMVETCVAMRLPRVIVASPPTTECQTQ